MHKMHFIKMKEGAQLKKKRLLCNTRRFREGL
jgi:hypothetical protein